LRFYNRNEYFVLYKVTRYVSGIAFGFNW